LGRACSTNGEKRNSYRMWLGKPEAKRPLGRLSRRGVDSMKMNLRETGWGGMHWIDLDQDREQWRALEHYNEPSGSVKFCEFLE
jgi:hypothetical protein